MKRLQLFEFEDAAWFPPSIRASMTRMITVLHGWFQSPKHISTLLSDVIREAGRHHIVDFCSGDGGPMIEALAELQKSTEYSSVSLTLTDLYPNRAAIDRIAATSNGQIVYRNDPVDATQFRESDGHTIRTIIAGFHHMPPEKAKTILESAARAGDPILVYEISDNSIPPKYLWWIGLPLNFIFGLVVAACVRPMTPKHFFYSFIVPVIPLCFAWDGSVSNARTYTESDLQELMSNIEADNYQWTIGRVDAKPAKHLYLLGTVILS